MPDFPPPKWRRSEQLSSWLQTFVHRAGEGKNGAAVLASACRSTMMPGAGYRLAPDGAGFIVRIGQQLAFQLFQTLGLVPRCRRG